MLTSAYYSHAHAVPPESQITLMVDVYSFGMLLAYAELRNLVRDDGPWVPGRSTYVFYPSAQAVPRTPSQRQLRALWRGQPECRFDMMPSSSSPS
jgi:hypothetical protein